jgi:chemotaxis protein MotB
MSDHAVKELVIIRHRADDHGDSHHGGVWKIAFADFMTAMMAFFLVMWLINASNEATKKAVASYFNPIKLADVTTNPRGVQDPHYGASSQDSVATHGETMSRENLVEAKADSAQPVTATAAPAAVAPPTGTTNSPAPAGSVSGGEGLVVVGGAAIAEAKLGPPGGDPVMRAEPRELAPRAATPISGVAPMGKKEQRPAPYSPAQLTLKEEVSVEAGEIRKALVQELGPGNGKLGPVLTVKAESDGVLISLTDQLGFSMFQVGSTVPNATMIDALKSIGRVLSQRTGSLVIRGHTDGRKYHSETNDNWRLSSDRAHIAYANLIKGGVNELRVERIEGLADRSLLKASDPLASENRRIEILIRSSAHE